MLASTVGDLEIVQGIVALGAEIDLPTYVSETIPALLTRGAWAATGYSSRLVCLFVCL